MSFSLNGVSTVLENIVFIVTAEYTKLPLLYAVLLLLAMQRYCILKIYLLCKPL